MLPASHIRSATLEILASATLAKVESVLPEETVAIRDGIATFTACARNSPPVASIGTMVPEQHPSMTTTLEELKSHETPSTTNVPSGHSSTPAVQAIIVNGVPIVDPQLASVIRDELEVVTAAPEDSQAASPTHCKVIATSETRPFATCVAIVNHLIWK